MPTIPQAVVPTPGYTYNLEMGARLLGPIVTPLRNVIPRILEDQRQDDPVPSTVWASYKGSPIRALHYMLPTGRESMHAIMDGPTTSSTEFSAVATANLLRAIMIGHEWNLITGANPRTCYPTIDCQANYHPSFALSGAEVPIDSDPNAFFGLLAQITIPGVFAVIEEPTSSEDYLLALQDAARRLYERGVTTATAYVDAKHGVLLQELLGIPADEPLHGRTLAQWSPTHGKSTELALHLHLRLPEDHTFIAPTMLPEDYFEAMGPTMETPVPWSFAVTQGWLQVYDSPDHFSISQRGALRVHTPGLCGLVRGA